MATIWRRHPEVAHVGDEDRAALLALHHLDRPAVILEGSSAVIWAQLAEPIEEDDLVVRLAEHYDVPTHELADPVLAFLDEMRHRDLTVSEETS